MATGKVRDISSIVISVTSTEGVPESGTLSVQGLGDGQMDKTMPIIAKATELLQLIKEYNRGK
ncbi:MAG: hypothetical protein WC022_01860 [Parcubacteria group bacterium]